mmetsp:Transcript_6159/g.18610  ORF Transcript_6159/g.18610 Transcript_6159/m.18610 type:complete len:280 (+) Transcript_6159:88-927(+)
MSPVSTKRPTLGRAVEARLGARGVLSEDGELGGGGQGEGGDDGGDGEHEADGDEDEVLVEGGREVTVEGPGKDGGGHGPDGLEGGGDAHGEAVDGAAGLGGGGVVDADEDGGVAAGGGEAEEDAVGNEEGPGDRGRGAERGDAGREEGEEGEGGAGEAEEARRGESRGERGEDEEHGDDVAAGGGGHDGPDLAAVHLEAAAVDWREEPERVYLVVGHHDERVDAVERDRRSRGGGQRAARPVVVVGPGLGARRGEENLDGDDRGEGEDGADGVGEEVRP